MVKAISFTGSTRAGAEIARVAAPMFKKLSLELGGKNPNIIFADCDYGKNAGHHLFALPLTIRDRYASVAQGFMWKKICTKNLKTILSNAYNNCGWADPADPKSQLGAVVSKAHFEKVLSYIDLARTEGGRVLCGGQALQLPGAQAGGWFIAPTVIEGLRTYCRSNQEEIFGPVVTIQPFEDEADALAQANDSPYGLSATIWTSHLQRAHRMAAQLQCGIVWINTWMLRDLRTPFGGVKNSGMGREGGWRRCDFLVKPKM